MKLNVLTCLVGATLLVNLSACSSVKEMFPDKEMDYQFTTEIPKLIIPSDLGAPAPSASSTASKNTETTTATAPETENKPEAESKPEESENQTANSEKTSTDTAADDQPAIDPKSITVDILESSNHISYLRINTPFSTAWRAVSKGLSRQSIEVSERNEAEKTFTVQYDPDEKPIEDGSYMDEINFMFHGFQSNEKEYVLKLVETNKQTDMVILDSEQKPVTDEGSLKLLKVLRQSIKANLAGK
jgi:outer membrane protein assembly factor BamC